jgi:hypothetical protein
MAHIITMVFSDGVEIPSKPIDSLKYALRRYDDTCRFWPSAVVIMQSSSGRVVIRPRRTP